MSSLGVSDANRRSVGRAGELTGILWSLVKVRFEGRLTDFPTVGLTFLNLKSVAIELEEGLAATFIQLSKYHHHSIGAHQ